MSYKWGIDLIVSILFYILAIVLAGILLNKRYIFITSAVIGGTLAVIGYLQNKSLIQANRYWIYETWGLAEISAAVLIFFIIATITWLSNYEIEKSIAGMKKLEIELKEERDSLEVKVKQRTEELKKVQAEKMVQLYRFAEFGKISSGLFHDLINPLNAVSLNLEKVNNTQSVSPIAEAKEYVENAVRAAKRLEDLVVAVRKQLRREETKSLFRIDEEIRHVIEVLSYKAKKANVQLKFFPLPETEKNFNLFGDAVKFNQLVLNLVANGIDACSVHSNEPNIKWVNISLIKEPQAIVMLIEDNGEGIPDCHMDKIFEPFFTTKSYDQGLGIGLAMSKSVVERDFRGLITVESKVGQGTYFKVYLPLG